MVQFGGSAGFRAEAFNLFNRSTSGPTNGLGTYNRRHANLEQLQFRRSTIRSTRADPARAEVPFLQPGWVARVTRTVCQHEACGKCGMADDLTAPWKPAPASPGTAYPHGLSSAASERTFSGAGGRYRNPPRHGRDAMARVTACLERYPARLVYKKTDSPARQIRPS